MQIIAKMKCESVNKTPFETEEVRLVAVYSDDPNNENKSFADATPSASVNLTISNKQAHGAFELNKEYYVRFEAA